MPKWTERLNAQVIERDEGLCILCRAPAWYKPHHIVPRSRGKRWSPKLWHLKNMCCVCPLHHDNTVALRVKLLERMVELGHDMAWATEFMGAWEDQ